MAGRDLGTTGEGTLHFWYQRISGLINLFLGSACITALSFMGRLPQAELLAWFSQPWVIGLMLTFILSALWHMKLGLNVIIDDYISSEGWRLFSQILNIFITLSAGILAILALLQIMLGNGLVPEDLINPLINQKYPNEAIQ